MPRLITRRSRVRIPPPLSRPTGRRGPQGPRPRADRARGRSRGRPRRGGHCAPGIKRESLTPAICSLTVGRACIRSVGDEPAGRLRPTRVVHRLAWLQLLLSVRSRVRSLLSAWWPCSRGLHGASGPRCSASPGGRGGGWRGRAAARVATDTASSSSCWARSRGASGPSGMHGAEGVGHRGCRAVY